MRSDTMSDVSSRAIRQHQKNDLRIIYGVSFLLFLTAAIVLRVMPWRWRLFGGRGNDRSVFEEARATTNRIMPFVFMA